MKRLVVDLGFKLAIVGVLVYFVALLLNEPILLHEENTLLLTIEILVTLCLVAYMFLSIIATVKAFWKP